MSQAVLSWDTLDPYHTTGLLASGVTVPAPAAGMPNGPGAPSPGAVGNSAAAHFSPSRPMFWGAVLIGLTFVAVGASTGNVHASAREHVNVGPLHEDAGAGA